MKKLTAILILLAVLFVPAAVFANGDQEAASAPATEVKAAPQVDTVAEAANAYFAEMPGSRIIASADLFAKMDAGEDMLIVDIRSAADYEKGHLKGAVNAPWGPAIADALAWLPDDKPVYVNCYSGQTAGQTVAVLNVAGIQAQSIKSGWNFGISKTEGYEAYTTTEAALTPDASGVKYDAAIKAAAEGYFKAIPDAGSNIWPASKVKEALDAEDDITIVSIRQPDAYAGGHVESAINIPWAKGMQEKFTALPKDEVIVVYCYTGQTAGQTVGILRLLGYNAVSMKSGMGSAATGGTGWGEEGFPVVQ